MTHALPPYPAYRDSGVTWLVEIPAHWSIKRLKFAALINPRTSELKRLASETEVSFLPMERIGEDGLLDLRETRPIQALAGGYTSFKDGDVLIAKITPCYENGKGALCAGLIGGMGFGTTELHVLRATTDLDPKFLFYLTRASDFRAVGAAMMDGAAGQKRVPQSFLENTAIGIPPFREQRAIAAFLDRETARLDALIAKKERLLALLAEKRAALISHAVTKGLDPSVPMRDSGVAWLGEIPAHWEVKRLKFLTSFVTSGSRGWAQYYADDGPLFLRIGNLSRIAIDLDLSDVQHVSPPLTTEVDRTRVQGDDILISITAYIGSVGLAPREIDEAYVNQHIALTRPRQDRIYPRWAAYCLLSWVGQAQFGSLLYGGTKDGLGLDDVEHLALVIPPRSEQELIVDSLDRGTVQLDALAVRVRAAIDKLREYRAALIAAAVTGKIDVREAAIHE